MQRCSWRAIDNLHCQEKYCKEEEEVVPAGRSLQTVNTTLLSFSSECCWAQDSQSQCTQSPIECPNRFANRGWSVCCPPGQFYLIEGRVCSRICSGLVFQNALCYPEGRALDLRSDRPGLMSLSVLCNGRVIPQSLPFCCPEDFFLNGALGC